MHVPSISPTQPLAQSSSAAEEKKIASSCREFEGVLWRQILEKSLQSMLSQPEGGADKTGTYGYMISDALAHSISGGPHSFAAMLETQLTVPTSRSR
jgi:hypothetical protein